jgi:hypothetical protein
VYESNWKPGDREGNFLDYNFDVNVYSMIYRPPAQQAETLMGILDRIAPYAPMLQAQGGVFNIPKMLADLSFLLDLPKLRDWVTFANPPETEEGDPSTNTKPPNTTRTYNRVSSSTGPTGPGKYADMAQQWTSLASNNQTQAVQ